ncbi:kinase-like domain-containing protein, partial [Mycena rosella]
LVKALTRLARASQRYPKCLPLPELHTIGKQVAAGGYGDVWKGHCVGQTVSVKVMRLFQDADVQVALKGFGREALIWRQLCHPNILPFFGLYYLDNRLCLVSPWMENGNIFEYLRRDLPGTDPLSLLSPQPATLDVAQGLKYLHENHVVHGDLKALNILVTPSRRACIADFGLSSIGNAVTMLFTHSTANPQGGTVRYQSPELLSGESQNHFSSDVYAFACVCYEILERKPPFHDIRNDAAVMFKVLGGSRPPRPASCSGTTVLDGLWGLILDCWQENADARPTAAHIVERLVGPPVHATTTECSTDWDEKFSSRFRRSLQVQPLASAVIQIGRIIFGDG